LFLVAPSSFPNFFLRVEEEELESEIKRELDIFFDEI